jgi:hypothetical protein
MRGGGPAITLLNKLEETINMALFMLDYFHLPGTFNPLSTIQSKFSSPIKKEKKEQKEKEKQIKNYIPCADCDRNLILYA